MKCPIPRIPKRNNQKIISRCEFSKIRYTMKIKIQCHAYIHVVTANNIMKFHIIKMSSKNNKKVYMNRPKKGDLFEDNLKLH